MIEIGVSPSGKARGFDPRMRRFESCHPNQFNRDNLVAEMRLYSGNANPQLAEQVAKQLGTTLGKVVVGRFSDGEIMVELHESVRGVEVFIIQSTGEPTNDNLMELMIMADAMRRASAASITAVIPYFGYARQDRRVRSARVPITAKVVADMLASVGITRVITVDLHAEQIQGFFHMPVDNIYASPVILEDIRSKRLDKLAVVSPDVGGVVRARAIAKRLDDSALAIIDKRRPEQNQVEVMNIIGDVADCNCILVDDIVDTAGTLCQAAAVLKEHGARTVSAYATHAILSGSAIDNIDNSVLDEVVVTNTVPLQEAAKNCSKIRQLNLSKVLAETLVRVSHKESVSSLFSEE